jgi:spore coat protein U-like protein
MSSHIRSNLPIGLAALAGFALAVPPATAQVQQDQKLQVQAFIGDLCTVTSASLDFGSSVDVSTNTHADGSIEINCATETTFDVQLDGGLNFNANVGARAMSGGGSDLFYTLYKDSSRSVLWGVNESVPATITGTGSVPVYGSVLQQTNGHTVGLHTDEVTITLVF